MSKLESIFLVEDDEIDVMTVKRALRDLKTNYSLQVATNGEEALQALKAEPGRLPSLILLDINMPKMNGIEFLREIRKDQKLRRIPVVVLTTSKEEHDRATTYTLGISGYIIKPVEYAKFVDIMAIIDKYWRINVLPEAPAT